jgi:hypothetical protein
MGNLSFSTADQPEPVERVERGPIEPGQCLWVRRPFDEQKEHGHVIILAHRCDPSTWNIRNWNPEDGQVATLAWAVAEHRRMQAEEGMGLDRVLFPVGAVGRGFPKGVPFRVPGECMACDRHFEKWFGWKRDGIVIPR